MGGISTAEDAIEFLLAGASAIMVGTANFVNPTACVDVANGIKEYLRKNNMKSVKELVGALTLNS